MPNFLTLIITLIVLSGCQTIPPPRTNLEIGPTARQFLEINDERSALASSNLLQVGINGFNSSIQKRRLRYRFAWLDANHFELPGLSSRWQYKMLRPRESFSLEMVAPTTSAIHYKVYLFNAK